MSESDGQSVMRAENWYLTARTAVQVGAGHGRAQTVQAIQHLQLIVHWFTARPAATDDGMRTRWLLPVEFFFFDLRRLP